MPLEKDVEKAFVKRVKDLGGTAEKFTSPQKRSVPDRLVTLPGGRIIFAEIKGTGRNGDRSTGKGPRQAQDAGL